MTTATETITEFTQAQIAHRKACAFLKGILCGYADKEGYKYNATTHLTPDFAAGFKCGSDGWIGERNITATHILHNRLRNRPPHTGSQETDAKYGIAWPERQLKKYLGVELAAELEVLNG